ncbi:MAG: phosphate signaling complex protein PhoU [Actinomycetota bacterium]
MSTIEPEHAGPEPVGAEHRLAYHRELEQVTAAVIRLGALACETIPRGTEVLLGGDLGNAQTLIDGDDEIDRLTVEIEQSCFNLIALQAPMAGELRRLMAIIKVVAEIERSADLMVNICKAARRMYGSELTPLIRGVLAAMSREANKMLRLSIDAFADENTSLAVALGDIDDELDELNRDIVEAIFEAHHEGAIELRAAVQLALIARYYERIGDHAVNIGERVNYMVTGWLPEHNGMLRADHRHQLMDEEVVDDDDGRAAPDGPDD